MENENKALVSVSEKSLAKSSSKNLGVKYDNITRGLKVAGGVGLWLGGAFCTFAPILPLQVAGWSLVVAGGIGLTNGILKNEPSLMFMTSKKKGVIEIQENMIRALSSDMKGYTAYEKGGMMVLQTLVGFSRWKENLKGSSFEVDENGNKIYDQKISTTTHGINIKTLSALEKLGYIKIDSVDDKTRGALGSLIGLPASKKKSLLLAEKIGFKNWPDLKKIFKAKISGDKETLDSMRKDMKQVNFRLTDKEINFEELYNRCANLKEVTSKEEKLALMRLGIVFDNVKGILANKNIDIEKDMFGRDIIKYGKKYSFSNRISKKKEEEGIGVKPVKLNDELRKNVRTNEEIALESSKREEIEVKSVEKSKNEEETHKISNEDNLTI